MKIRIICLFFLYALFSFVFSEDRGEQKMDDLKLRDDNVKIFFFGHSSLMIEYQKKTIYLDPVSQYADYDRLPKADFILITHEHGDHLDLLVIEKLLKDTTEIISNQISIDKIQRGTAMDNYKSLKFGDIRIEAVPAYNTTAGRERFHPKGRDNGYILTLGESRIYVAGDTEDIPEMKDFNDITVAFLPVNQPYTMTPDQLLNAVKMINPDILYPYHYGNTDTREIERLIHENTDTEVRIRHME